MLMKTVMPKKFQLNVIPGFSDIFNFRMEERYTIFGGSDFCLHR